MKLLKISMKAILGLFLIFSFASCEQENGVEVSNELSIEDYLEYKENNEHTNVKAEHGSLEELNKAFKDNNLPEITLGEVNMTIEEYNEGQEKLKNLDKYATSRCNHASLKANLDFDGDGYAGTNDIVYARETILGIREPSFEGYLYGFATFEVNRTRPQLSVGDIVIGIQFYLNQQSRVGCN